MPNEILKIEKNDNFLLKILIEVLNGQKGKLQVSESYTSL